MKRKLIASILGIASSSAMVASSYGQGQVIFANYAYDPGFTAAPVTYAANNVPAGKAGQLVGSEFNADLLFSLNGGVTYSAAPNSTTAFYGSDVAPGAGLGTPTGYAGLFQGNSVLVPGYTSGAIFFEVQAFNAATYASATVVGTSAAFSIPSLSTVGSATPVGDLFNGGAAGTYLQSFTVANIPEPTTLALAGLGMASLLAIRRRK